MRELDELYRLYAQDVYRFGLRMTGSAQLAEELTAETFYRAVKNIDSFSGNCKMSAWLIQIFKNLYVDYLRKETGKNVFTENEEQKDKIDIALSLENKELSLDIHKILHTLEEPYKEVFTLRIFGELSFREIGSLFGKSDGWARTVFFRAKEKIIFRLKEEELI